MQLLLAQQVETSISFMLPSPRIHRLNTDNHRLFANLLLALAMKAHFDHGLASKTGECVSLGCHYLHHDRPGKSIVHTVSGTSIEKPSSADLLNAELYGPRVRRTVACSSWRSLAIVNCSCTLRGTHQRFGTVLGSEGNLAMTNCRLESFCRPGQQRRRGPRSTIGHKNRSAGG